MAHSKTYYPAWIASNSKPHPSLPALDIQEPILVEVECTILDQGIERMTFVGIPSTIASDIRERIRAAFSALDIPVPQQPVTFNIYAPFDFEARSSLDTPCALALLAAMGYRDIDRTIIENLISFGELALDGTVRSSEIAMHAAEALDDIDPTVAQNLTICNLEGKSLLSILA